MARMGAHAEDEVSHIPAEALSYEAFRREYMLANQPVVVSGATNNWRAFREWRTTDGKPNLALLREKFGKSGVQVADCSQHRFGDQERLTMTVSDFISYWEQHIAARDSAPCALPPQPPSASEPIETSANQPKSPEIQSFPPPDTLHSPQNLAPLNNASIEPLCSPVYPGKSRDQGPAGGSVQGEEARLLYLKDWHLVAEYPGYRAYETPVYFQDDWLNEYLDRHPMQYEAPSASMADGAFGSGTSRMQTEQCGPTASDDSTDAPQLHLDCTKSAELPSPNIHSASLQSDSQSAQRLPAPNETPLSGHEPSSTHNQTSPRPTHSASQSHVSLPVINPPHEPTSNRLPPANHQPSNVDSERIHTESAGPLPGVECADYRFVYMGPAGSWTPCHADVLRSYSWSANVCGRKLWRLLPPDQAWMLFDRHGRSSVYDIDAPIDAAQFPHFAQTRWLECTQEPGEAIFVPSGWFHQVTNLEDTISINHNWLNGYNLHWAWALLQDDYHATVASIEDCRDMSTPEEFEELCQRNLQLNSGTNYSDFLAFVGTMALDKARKLRARTIGGRADTADSTVADTADTDMASDLTVNGRSILTDSTAADAADVASDLLGLSSACKVLREMGDQPLYKAEIGIDGTESMKDKKVESDDILVLSRDSAIACGPWAIAEAVESVMKEVRERTKVKTKLSLQKVISWRGRG
ncbi:hypothetical protein KFL_001750210 [Klebsormidium nitens]|uniref:JmjC domain-containing protein n=1 Tax=Klebsormidium nitens TaxID=105231 RepID=A0A1Y1HZJ9_KLENI|nr:hypothetical protein KFL_001750210 [Klebsormidium nitens]|eukprot:GAQ84084.1 hypothetical protein KFL_001750210 [Klebsormidium nitens]